MAAASGALDVPKSSVSRGVRRLETELATPLLDRTTREVTLTEAGAALFERCAGLLKQLDWAARPRPHGSCASGGLEGTARHGGMRDDRGRPTDPSAKTDTGEMSRLYNGPMVDAHHHFWDPARNQHPWLAPGVRIPFRYGDYEAIKRPYLPEDYRRDSIGHDVRETVYVETEWDPADPIGETRYAASLAERSGWPNAIVAQAWLDRADVAEVLEAQAACSLVRSVRHKPGGPRSPAEVGRSRTLMSDDRWRQGFALLERYGLHFDLQTPWWNLDEAVRLATDFPRTTIVLNHAGLPSDRSAAGLSGWRAALERFALPPNSVVKISGLGLAGRPWRRENNQSIVDDLIAVFGADRAMFASNFPVDSLCGSYDDIMSGFKHIVAGRSDADQAALFCGTARRIYRTEPPTPD